MKLKKIYTAHFPKKGFTALTILPFVFVRKDQKKNFGKKAERHETTHALQQMECLILPFFILYGLEWLIKLLFCKFDADRAYMSISFEQEAYKTQNDKDYNNARPHYAWRHYIFTLTPKKK